MGKKFFAIQICLVLFGLSTFQKADAATHTVVIEGMKFVPESLTVSQGDKIIWFNKDFFPHTVTAEKVFDSKEIKAAGSWIKVVKKKGSFPYLCTLHPTMKGRLIVR